MVPLKYQSGMNQTPVRQLSSQGKLRKRRVGNYLYKKTKFKIMSMILTAAKPVNQNKASYVCFNYALTLALSLL